MLTREVTRKQFLTITALGMASVTGIGTIIELLTGKHLRHRLQESEGYSSGDYGGKHISASTAKVAGGKPT